MQTTITFYTLTMAAFMLLGAKLGDVWGRRRALIIGAIVYAIGSFVTAISPNIWVLFTGWAILEGLGAVLVVPAIAALIAVNYTGRERVTAYAVIGASSGVAVAAGPLIGGYVTTYFSWRYVFIAEVVIMAIVLAFSRVVKDSAKPSRVRIDALSVLLSAAGLVLIVLGLLQTKTWGWILPSHPPTIGGVEITPFGLSPVPFVIAAGVVLIWLFVRRQRRLLMQGRAPLLRVAMLRIRQLRAGVGSLAIQYTVTAGLFFIVPIYLQLTLGLDAVTTGLRIFPLSVALILFSIVGTILSRRFSPKRVVRLGQLLLVLSGLVLLSSVRPRSELGAVRGGDVRRRGRARASRVATRQRHHVRGERDGGERSRRGAGRLPEPRIVPRHGPDRLGHDRDAVRSVHRPTSTPATCRRM